MAGVPLVHSPSAAGEGGRNVGNVERLASGVAGGLLVAAGIRRRSYPGLALALLGGELVRRGATGHCAVYNALDVSTAESEGGADAAGTDAVPGATALAEATITVGAPPETVYRAFRDPANVARLLGDAASVRVDDPAVEHWTVRAPFGREIAFDAEYLEDRPGDVIRWRTRPGALVPHDATVRFVPAPGDWGTEVRFSLRYDPPGGPLGDAAARLFGGVPDKLALRTLRRLKSLVETGEIPTLAHNPSGRRDTTGGRAGGPTPDAGDTHLPLSAHTA